MQPSVRRALVCIPITCQYTVFEYQNNTKLRIYFVMMRGVRGAAQSAQHAYWRNGAGGQSSVRKVSAEPNERAGSMVARGFGISRMEWRGSLLDRCKGWATGSCPHSFPLDRRRCIQFPQRTRRVNDSFIIDRAAHIHQFSRLRLSFLFHNNRPCRN